MSRPEKINVVYLGRRYGNFFVGTVLEAEARHMTRDENRKRVPCDYHITDSEGDLFPITDDGETFRKDWYRVPDGYDVGDTVNDATRRHLLWNERMDKK